MRLVVLDVAFGFQITGENMKIFLDTEFTSFEDPKLISVGMVSEDGEEFYRELADGCELTECSMFVVAWVLPWLAEGLVGRNLSSLLGQHLDLVQHVCDVDKVFEKSREKRLLQALKTDSELLVRIPEQSDEMVSPLLPKSASMSHDGRNDNHQK